MCEFVASLIISLFCYFYNDWRINVKRNRRIITSFLWKLRLNQSLLSEWRNGTAIIESVCQHLILLDAYPIRYIPIMDDQLSSNLFAYNLLVQKARMHRGLSSDELELLCNYSESCISNLDGSINLVDNCLAKLSPSGFLAYLGLPITVNWIAQKYLIKQRSNDKRRY